ncbi:hypothetical protein [Paenibacillus polymyxa]|uniref:hypothetical protein n=1 Tax=Paenibacillus polymyxa TaxID=1406 RepID=UPI00042620F0|nr:hypothetical protein [Paenibacillus polymyxa]
MDIIRAKDINSKPIEEQLEFYKKQFGYRHCSLYGWELRDDWVMCDGELYRTEAFDQKIEEEKEKLQHEIDQMNEKIADKIVKYEKLTNKEFKV